MQDFELYSEWRKQFSADANVAAIEMQDWLRSGWLRITSPTHITEHLDKPPFDPFGAYVHDEDSALSLMASLRNMSLRKSADDAIILRKSVSKAICAWNFSDKTSVTAIRFSFRTGSIFGCTEICDTLAGHAQTLVFSPQPVITGLADMAGYFGIEGRNLIERLVAASCESNNTSHLPYLLTRLIELCSQADVNKQRDLIFNFIEKYGPSLAKCHDSIDALEALTDIIVNGLRLIEGVLTPDQVNRLDSITVYLDDESIKSIPQVREAFIDGTHHSDFIRKSQEQSGNFERLMLGSGV